MITKTTLVGTAAVLALAAAAATPANAVVTEFATFSALTTYNVYYNNPQSGINNSTGKNTGTGKSTNASFYTVATPTSTVAAPVQVDFSFINEGATLGNAVHGVVANFSLSGTTSGPAVLDPFSHNLEQLTTGTFSYKTTTAITVGSHTYAAGSVLLAGAFSQGVLAGKGSLAGLNADNDAVDFPGDALTFTSDFVTFQPAAALGLSYTLASIFPSPLSDAKVGTYALKTFRTDVGGQFTADPAPHVNAVPEPASWALMIVGFGIAGASVRSRRKVAA